MTPRRVAVVEGMHVHLTRIVHRAAGRIAARGHLQAAADLIAADWEAHQAAVAAIHEAEAEAWRARVLAGQRFCPGCGITRLTPEYPCPLCEPTNGANHR